MVTKQFTMTIKKIEGHLRILQWMYILVVTFMALITADFILTMLEKCHHFTLTESHVTKQKKLICQWQVQSLRKRDESGRGSHLEQKIWFLTINQVQPTLFL